MTKTKANTLKTLGRDDILDIDDQLYDWVPVPEWGGRVRIKGMSGYERDLFEQDAYRPPAFDGESQAARLKPNLRARMCAASIVDGGGALLFTQEDLETLGRKSNKALSRVFEACTALSGSDDADGGALEGNLDETPNDSSSSG